MLVAALRRTSKRKLRELMHISEVLAEENAARYHRFDTPESLAAAKPALLAFKGDVYRGLVADDFSAEQLVQAQGQIRILSGLYGLLRPLDLIQPYRLEMGTALKVGRKPNLYQFWGEQITDLLNADIADTCAKLVLNAASKEYTNCLQPELLSVPVVDIDFKELRGGQLKFITYNAKLARGRLAQLVVREKITDLAGLHDLDIDGYQYDAERSEVGMVAFTKR